MSEISFHRDVDFNSEYSILGSDWLSNQNSMLKGTYTFPDLTKISVYFNPKLSNADSVYVEWYTHDKVKQIMWLPSKGLRYTI